MNRKWLLLVGVADLCILSLLDQIAFRYFLYWKYAWFDIVMHLGGGLAVGLLSSWAYLGLLKGDPLSWRRLFSFNLAFALVIGFVWEIFELLADRIVVFVWFDSSKDMLFSILGSLLAGLLAGIISIWLHQMKEKK